jgi:hypothetical protein
MAVLVKDVGESECVAVMAMIVVIPQHESVPTSNWYLIA